MNTNEEKNLNTEEEVDIYTANYKETSNQGLVADDFHGEAPLLVNDEIKNMQDEDGIKVNYGYTGKQAKEALKIFQKNTIYKKNIIYTGIIFIIFILYVVDLIQQPDKFNMFLSTMCVIVMGFIWYFPLNHIKQMVKIIDSQPYEEKNVITFYEKAIMVGEGDTSAVYYFDAQEKRDILNIWETNDLIIVGYGKERVFIVPKKCCNNEVDNIVSILKTGLNDRYKDLTK